MSSLPPTISVGLSEIPTATGEALPVELPRELSAAQTTTTAQSLAGALLVGLLAASCFVWSWQRVFNGVNEAILAFYGVALTHRLVILAAGILHHTSFSGRGPGSVRGSGRAARLRARNARRSSLRRWLNAWLRASNRPVARSSARRSPGADPQMADSRPGAFAAPGAGGTVDETAGYGNVPRISILVPLYKEAEVIPQIAGAMERLKYPRDRMEVLLLLEENDRETQEACADEPLPEQFRVVVVPDGRPRTKPRACNYGLSHCRGELVVVFDAEDQPETDQLLKAAQAMAEGGPDLCCLQARLAYYNPRQNLLTRWFAAEYMAWFELTLPGLHGIGAPIPLGGTSNYFRADALRRVGGWDSWNVAEDCDLGVRIHRCGMKVNMLDSTTWEEACPQVGFWLKQRSRWVKGYLQTWLVLNRRPRDLWREVGPWSFLNLQLLIGGSMFCLLLNPLYWGLTLLWWTHPTVWESSLMVGPTLVLGNLSFVVGNLVFMLCHASGALRRRQWDLAGLALLVPAYWVLMSIAAWKAVIQLVVAPHHWEKTMHGLARMPPAEPLGEGSGLSAH